MGRGVDAAITPRKRSDQPPWILDSRGEPLDTWRDLTGCFVSKGYVTYQMGLKDSSKPAYVRPKFRAYSTTYFAIEDVWCWLETSESTKDGVCAYQGCTNRIYCHKNKKFDLEFCRYHDDLAQVRFGWDAA